MTTVCMTARRGRNTVFDSNTYEVCLSLEGFRETPGFKRTREYIYANITDSTNPVSVDRRKDSQVKYDKTDDVIPLQE